MREPTAWGCTIKGTKMERIRPSFRLAVKGIGQDSEGLTPVP